jgi:Tfp pilus assembly protein PilV
VIRRVLTRLRREEGLTLTELLVAMPILSIALVAITATFVVLMNSNNRTTGQLTEQATFFPTLDTMMQDMRTMMPPTLGGSPLLAANSTSISFYSPDGLSAQTGATSPFHLREVAYRFSGGALQQQVVESTNTFASVTSTTPWGSWTSSAGTFPLTTFPTANGWTTLLGSGLASDGSSPPLASATFTYYDGDGDLISSPVSTANIGLVRSIEVTVTASVPGHPARQTTYDDTATIRETQPTQ